MFSYPPMQDIHFRGNVMDDAIFIRPNGIRSTVNYSSVPIFMDKLI